MIEKNFLNIPNALSFFRILLLPVLIKFIPEPKNYILVFITISFILLTDFFDGFLARKYNQITTFGKIIDPLADKIVIVTITYLIAKYKNFPIWAFYIIAGKEFIVASGAVLLYKKKHFVPASNILGKLAVFSISCSILSYLCFYDFMPNISYILLLTGLSFYAISFLSYLIRYFRIMDIIPGLNKVRIFRNQKFF